MKTLDTYKVSKQLTATLARLALGYEGSLSFAYGYLYALKQNKLIDTKQYNMLCTVHASTENDNLDFYITAEGNLGQHPAD